ncbi:MAG TPA: sugar phosphate isomerase/epimerase [Isosphaeraceae bacterium]|nr:sugar phosphate isomerase/epimerase [Isosphaeraceae bacterium]
MKLGFVTAIVPELSFEDVLVLASENGYSCVEVMCWPPGTAERRYAGVTHIDVLSLGAEEIARIQEQTRRHGVSISSLGYYPNPLDPDEETARAAVEHLKKVIDASAALGVNRVTSFVGRNPKQSVDENWPRFLETWRPIVRHAEERGVRIGIENCPMLFTADEWPGGKNLAISPPIWRRMFADIPSPSFGLNYDPSHLVWMRMDYLAPIREFADRLVHVHAKDARIDRKALDEHGVLAYPNLWHTPKIPGLGDVNWGAYFSTLTDAGYDGPACVEVEDRAFEGSIERRKASLIQSQRYLQQYVT